MVLCDVLPTDFTASSRGILKWGGYVRPAYTPGETKGHIPDEGREDQDGHEGRVAGTNGNERKVDARFERDVGRKVGEDSGGAERTRKGFGGVGNHGGEEPCRCTYPEEG